MFTLPKKITTAQFSLIMLAMIFATVIATMAFMFFCDYWNQTNQILAFGGLAVIVEVVILAVGALGMESA